MQSTNVRQIKEALREQAFRGSTRVSCPMGPVVAARWRKGQLRVMIRGWGRWYTVESVSIERMVVAAHLEKPSLLERGHSSHNTTNGGNSQGNDCEQDVEEASDEKVQAGTKPIGCQAREDVPKGEQAPGP
jgi:hypothetical protein